MGYGDIRDPAQREDEEKKNIQRLKEVINRQSRVENDMELSQHIIIDVYDLSLIKKFKYPRKVKELINKQSTSHDFYLECDPTSIDTPVGEYPINFMIIDFARIFDTFSLAALMAPHPSSLVSKQPVDLYFPQIDDDKINCDEWKYPPIQLYTNNGNTENLEELCFYRLPILYFNTYPQDSDENKKLYKSHAIGTNGYKTQKIFIVDDNGIVHIHRHPH